jgi:uncharacterized protein YbaR (Trm112 family)
MDKELLEILVCPSCHGSLELKGDKLFCLLCREEYIFNEGIPVLISVKKRA